MQRLCSQWIDMVIKIERKILIQELCTIRCVNQFVITNHGYSFVFVFSRARFPQIQSTNRLWYTNSVDVFFVGALNIFVTATENDCPAKFMANMIYGKLWISIIVHVILLIIFEWKTKADRNLRNRSNHNWFLTVGKAIRCRWRHANRIVMQPERRKKNGFSGEKNRDIWRKYWWECGVVNDSSGIK